MRRADDSLTVKNLRRIKSYYDRWIKTSHPLDPTNAWLSVFYFEWSRLFNDEPAFETAVALRSRSLSKIDFLDHSVFSSLGKHRIARYWKNAGFPEKRYELFHGEVGKYVEKRLLQHLRSRKKKIGYELNTGVAGLIVMAALFGSEILRQECRDALSSMLRRSPWGFYLDVRDDSLGSSGRVKLGIAHGLCGPMLALDHCADADSKRLSKKLFKTVLAIDSVRQNRSIAVQWPPIAGQTLFGWCGGEAGIGYALLKMTQGHFENSQSARQCQDIFQRGIDPSALPVKRLGLTLCHGVTGLTLLAHSAYQMQPSERLGALLDHWTSELNTRFQNHPVELPETGKATHLLDGSLGVGLTLLSRLSGSERPWESLFLVYKVRSPAANTY